jgi:hypothetical protein
MKRYLVAAGVGTLVFGGVLGSASALQINDPGVAQYGESFDLTCDDTGVSVTGYRVDSDAGRDSQSNGVQVSGISTQCEGKTLVAAVTDGSGNGLARGAVEITGNTVNVPYNIDGGPQVPLLDIGGVRLTIG